MMQGAQSAYTRQAWAFRTFANIYAPYYRQIDATYQLSDYMKAHPRVYKRMVAAYIVGQSITRPYFRANPHLKYARGARDTGVIVSWNTEAPEVDGTNLVLLAGGIAMNPITWTRKQTHAKARAEHFLAAHPAMR